MTRKNDVVITGLGVVSPVGVNKTELISYLKSSRSGITLWESPRLSKKFPAGTVPRDFSQEFSKLELPSLDRCSQMAIVAARQAISDASLDNFAGYGQKAGMFYGTVRGGAQAEDAWYIDHLCGMKEAARPFTVMAIMHNAAPAQISIRHQILGPVMTHSSACTSSGTAIGDAVRAIRDGYLDIAIAGGAEAPFTSMAFGGWDGTRALAPPDPLGVERSCKPFAKNRGGLVLGEGAAFLVLESAEGAKKRGAACYAELSGYGIASDGYHIGSPKAEGQALAIRAAIQDANIDSSGIDYINAHATATKGGDMVEAKAIRLAFQAAVDNVPVSSTKAVHGHLLGAASALELVITIAAMTESFIPATAHLDEVDPECALNHVAIKPILDKSIEHALSFSSGFGGTNVALVVSKNREIGTRRFSDSVFSN